MTELFDSIDLSDYNYNLAKDRIADFPALHREESKLLIAKILDKKIIHQSFNSISDFIPSKSLIVRNSTKVIPARIFLNKKTGGKIEIFIIRPIEPTTDYQISLNTYSGVVWECIFGGRGIKVGTELELKIDNFYLNAKILTKQENSVNVLFHWQPENSCFATVLEKSGNMPLPPYIKRDAEQIDKERYQTVYAKMDGSVAAPTAGLHFTPTIFDTLRDKSCIIEDIILHVGLGTFKPIETENLSNHLMHEEKIIFSKSLIMNIITSLKQKNNIIAVGTTSVRTLESLYWIGLKLYYNMIDFKIINLSQFEPYSLSQKYRLVEPIEIFENLLKLMENDNISFLEGNTQLFIIPGYDFKLINGIVTNFHLPKSTLLLLVSAFTGRDFWKEIYDNAIMNHYRFLSYGDSSLLLKSIE